MALIKCPECGKENVSDTANACPNCGFDIKTYFETKIREERVEKWNKEWNKMQQDKLKERMDKIEKPKPARVSKGLVIYSVISSILFWYSLVYLPSEIGDKPEILGCLLLECVLVGIPIYCHYGNYQKAKKDYELACQDLEAYKRKAVEEQDEFWETFDEMFHHKSNIHCPVCNSNNVKKISTANRAVSVGAVGLASSKIGKQYECKSCHHKW